MGTNQSSGDTSILSCCGVHQGDPQDPVVFAVGFACTDRENPGEVPGLLMNVWYLDDADGT